MSKFERLLDLRPGDLGRGVFLSLYYFFIIAAHTQGQNARDALFLSQFPASLLAWLDLLIVAIVGAVLAIYLRLGRTLSLINLLALTLCFFAANAVLFGWAAQGPHAHPLLIPAFYVWVGIFGVVSIAQVWTLFGFVLTGREAKRLVGFVGSGGILGGIAGGLLSRQMAARYGAESLLLSMAFCIAMAMGLVLVIAARNRNLAQTGDLPADDGRMKLQEGLRLVVASPHLRIIAALVCVGALTLNIAGWQFKAIMKVAFDGNQDAISQFRGTFDSVTGVLALAIQIFVTSRLLHHWGIRAALLVLPLGLIAGSGAIIASGALWAATLLAGTYKSVRNSMDTAALQLLYMPVTPDLRVQAKPFLDTVAQRSGEGLGALAVLLLTSVFSLEPAQFGWVVLGLLLLWVIIARQAGFQYLATLGDTLRQRRLSAEALQESPMDRSATQVFATELRSNDPDRIIYALDFLGEKRWRIAHSSIRQLLTHPAPRVRAKAVSILRLMGDAGASPVIERLIRDPDIDVRTEALLFLSQLAGVDPLERIQNLGDFSDFSVQAATVVFLARSGDTANLEAARFMLDRMIADRDEPGSAARLEAARLIRFVPEEFAPYLCALLEDDDLQVLGEAIRTAGVQQNPQYVSALIVLLGNPNVRQSAVDALTQFGKRIQDRLRDHLSDDHLSLEIRREIPDLLFETAQRDARDILLENLRQSDNILRFRIISALNKLRHCYPDLELDSSTIEVVLASEIMSHYHSYQILGNVDAHLDNQSFLLPLMKSIDHELERIFRLLKMLYPQHDLKSAFVALRSSDRTERDSALEFIDNALKLSIRRLLVPLLDGEIGLEEKVAFANSVLGATIDSTDDALQALIKAEDPWLKSCAAHLIGVLGLKQFEPEVDQWANDPDPLLNEKAQRARKRLAAAHA